MSNAVELAFDTSGEGPPLLILHGLFGWARNWQNVARQLASRYQVITVDARNHGRSPHTAGMDYTLMAADVAALLAKLQLHDVTLLGHSMGGKTAMTLALNDCSRVARVVVVDISPVPSEDQHTPMIDAMLALPPESLRRRSGVDALLRAAVPEDEIRLFLLQSLLPAENGGSWRFNLAALKSGMADLIGPLPVSSSARYDGPFRVIRGENSPRVNAEALPLIQHHFPAAGLHTVANAGHWPHAEAPVDFMRALNDCLLL